MERIHTRIAGELARPAPPAAQLLTDAIVKRHGDAVAAVLFYGSCLRRNTHEGVLDFYVLVDSYAAAYRDVAWLRRLWLRPTNALLPPSVFYMEDESAELGSVATKYALISTADFERAVQPSCWHPYIWSRFAQPALCTWSRDSESRRRAERAVSRAVITLAQRLAVFLPAVGAVQRFTLSAMWQDAFRRTYSSELRTEAPETIRGNYEADPERYDRVGADALATLAEEGWLLEANARAGAMEVRMSPLRRNVARLRWSLLRPLNKIMAFVRLLKTATTFGDWLPYALFKVHRHSDVRITLTERQRRHPLLFGWPVILRLLLRKDLR